MVKRIFVLVLLVFAAVSYGFEDFEGYVDSAAVQAQWGGFGGNNPESTPELETSGSHGGVKCLKLTDDGSVGWSVVFDSFAAQDWSDRSYVSVWVKGQSSNPDSSIVKIEFRADSEWGASIYKTDAFSINSDNWFEIKIPTTLGSGWGNVGAMLVWMSGTAGGASAWVDDVTLQGSAPVGAGVSYVISQDTPPFGGRPDDTGKDLANNRHGWFDYADPEWVEWAPSATGTPAYAEITFDLNEVTTLQGVAVSYMQNYAPGLTEFSFSDDGVTFSEPVMKNDYVYTPGVGAVKTTLFDFAGTQARYAKVVFHCMDDNANAWFFLSEVMFLEAGKDPVYKIDPSTPAYVDIVRGDNGLDIANRAYASDVYYDPAWVEWAPSATDTPAYAIIDFDMGEVVKFENMKIGYLNGVGGAVSPEDVEVSFYNDPNSQPTEAVVLSGFETEGYALQSEFALGGESYRYIKVKINCADYDPANWFFISEIEFNDFGSDFDKDGDVDTDDLGVIVENWLTDFTTPDGMDCYGIPYGDLNKDCVVDLSDLAILAEYWMFGKL